MCGTGALLSGGSRRASSSSWRSLKVAADQRRQPAAQAACLVGGLGLGRYGFFGNILVFARAMRRLRRAFLPNDSHEFPALLAQDALHAADGVALAIEEMADAAQKIEIVGTIIAPPAAALHRLDIAETAFPKSQHVLRQIELVRHFTDAAKCVRRLVIQSGLTPRCDLKNAVLKRTPVSNRLGVTVDAMLEDRRRLEHHHPARRDRHFLAGLGVAPNALALLAHHE